MLYDAPFYVGVLLVVLALGLFVVEFFTPGFGAFTAAGLVSFTIGLLIMFGNRLHPGIIALVVVLVGGFMGFAVYKIVKAHQLKVTTGEEDLIGKTAIARTELDPKGLVFFEGERWEAVSESGRIEVGDKVTVTRFDGLTLYVKKN